jgi:hypothetical protein
MMRHVTLEEAEDMRMKDAMTEMANRIYEAALFIETLEHAGKIIGNGHHAAQKIAAFAAKEVAERWKKKEEEVSAP